MGQTPEGARKAAKTQRKKYGKDHFKRIGAKGGRASKEGYFSRVSKKQLTKISRSGGHAKAKKFKEDNEIL